MKKKVPEASVFDLVKAGLEDSIAFSRGERMSLVTVEVPAPPPPMSAEDVAGIRKRFNMSQGVFAAALNVSPKTVQGWEQGARKPSNASLRLLQIAREEPRVILEAVRSKRTPTTAATKRASNSQSNKTKNRA